MGAQGGVIFPRDRLVTEIAAKWMGSMPTDFAIGNRIAAESMLPETSSTSIPMKRRITLIIIKTRNLFVVSLKIKLVRYWGTWYATMILLTIRIKNNKIMTAPEVIIELLMFKHIFLKVIVL